MPSTGSPLTCFATSLMRPDKHVVVALIFLKYLSDTFAERHQRLLAEVGEGADPEQPDEHRADNVFWVVTQARWQTLKGDNGWIVADRSAIRTLDRGAIHDNKFSTNPKLVDEMYCRHQAEQPPIQENHAEGSSLGRADARQAPPGRANRRDDRAGPMYLVEEFARFPAGEDRAPCLWRLNTGKPSYESVQSDYSSRGMISVLVEMLAPY
ncbi:MAG: type I restriction-modification system subunit M N-terminal domain-containing protein [Planctomycetia bacterium]|nr:type I restriction-modification system subunit M N-terminal domain-containing protein [Planctomycetia bacterium]